MKIASLLLLAACGAVKGNDQIEARPLDVGAFSRILVRADVVADITQGQALQATFATDTNLFERFETRVEGDTLVIDVKAGSDVRASQRPRLEVVMPTLASLQVEGAATMSVQGLTHSLDIDISGSGELTIEGAADTLTVDISGSGDVRAREFQVREASFDISGAGDIEATVRERVTKASISGSGTIELYGGASVQPDIDGAGTVNVH